MAHKLTPIPLFDEDHFSNCIVVPFPENGVIVDTAVVEKTAYIIVQHSADAVETTAHFHIVPPMLAFYADSFTYVGMFKIEGFRGTDFALLTVIQITDGDFGVFSKEFREVFGDEAADRIIAEARELKSIDEENTAGDLNSEKTEERPEKTKNDDELRKLWDFEIGGGEGL